MKIAVIGSVMIDLISYVDKIPAAGETKESTDFAISYGGKGANQAIAASKAGAEVMMLAKVGDDLFGKMAIQNFSHYDVDTAYVKKMPQIGNGMATILVDASSQNRILIHKGANLYLKPCDIQAAAEKLQQCSLFILQLEIELETVYAAIKFAKKYHIPILLNPAPACEILDIEKVRNCDFLVPNETELALLTKMSVRTEAEIKVAAQNLVQKGIKNIIVTMGEKGSLWVDAEHCEKVNSVKVNAIDTTGAGDAYIGCFAANYVKTKDIPFSMRQASAFAAFSVTKKGTQVSYPDKKKLEKFLLENA